MLVTGRYKVYGQMEDMAERKADVEEYVFQNGVVRKATKKEDSPETGIHTERHKVFAC